MERADQLAGPLHRPITFGDLASKWAPGSGSYSRMLEGIAERFEEFCERA